MYVDPPELKAPTKNLEWLPCGISIGENPSQYFQKGNLTCVCGGVFIIGRFGAHGPGFDK